MRSMQTVLLSRSVSFSLSTPVALEVNGRPIKACHSVMKRSARRPKCRPRDIGKRESREASRRLHRVGNAPEALFFIGGNDGVVTDDRVGIRHERESAAERVVMRRVRAG